MKTHKNGGESLEKMKERGRKMNRNTKNNLEFETAVEAEMLAKSPRQAPVTDDRIKTLFETSYVYRTYLKDD